MIEAKLECMQAQAMQRVITVTVFYVSTDRMAHISRMHANLVLTACLQTVLNQRIILGALKHIEMGYGIFSTVVDG